MKIIETIAYRERYNIKNYYRMSVKMLGRHKLKRLESQPAVVTEAAASAIATCTNNLKFHLNATKAA